MSASELKSWKETYASVENISAELERQIKGSNPSMEQHQLDFNKVLAELCF